MVKRIVLAPAIIALRENTPFLKINTGTQTFCQPQNTAKHLIQSQKLLKGVHVLVNVMVGDEVKILGLHHIFANATTLNTTLFLGALSSSKALFYTSPGMRPGEKLTKTFEFTCHTNISCNVSLAAKDIDKPFDCTVLAGEKRLIFVRARTSI